VERIPQLRHGVTGLFIVLDGLTQRVWDNPKAKHTMSNVRAWCARKKKEVKKKAAGNGSKKTGKT